MERGNGIERLTDRAVEKWIKAGGAKGQKLADGAGLYLTRLPSGRAAWQVRYALAGKQGTYSLGVYPEVSLSEAREQRKRVKDQAKSGVDPVQERRAQRVETIASNEQTFSELTTEWLRMQQDDWSDIHYAKSKRAIERDVLPTLGKLPVARITPGMVSRVIERIQNRGVRDTTAKIHQHVRAIFKLAQARGLRSDNPADPVTEIIKVANDAGHHPALLTFPELGEVLRKAEVVNTTPAVRLAARLIAFTSVRVSNAVEARWEHFHLDADPALWVIPRDEMKIRGKGRTHPHKVVLPEQLADELRRWRSAQPKDAVYVFPGNQGRDHLSREALEKAFRVTMGLAGKHSPHGWRSAFSTLAREETDFEGELIDLQLDHVHASKTAMAYDRGDRLQKRIALSKWWGDSLTRAERGAEVLPLRRKA